MLDISSAGHLIAGDDSLSGAIRELKEKLNIDVQPSELHFIKTIKKSSKYTSTFIIMHLTIYIFLEQPKKLQI